MKVGVLFIIISFSTACSEEVINNRPIIGILAQETSKRWGKHFPGFKSYIAASYVKWIEGSGARALPIKIKQKRSYYEELTRNLNGVLFPGGSASLRKSGYKTAATILYEEAIKVNQEEGVYFPIWTTCLGFELLVHLVAEKDIRKRCNSHDQALHLEFTDDYIGSSMFGNLPEDVEMYVRNDSVTSNYHRYCFFPEQFSEYPLLQEKMTVLSTNEDWDSAEFVSTVEHKYLPFYGVQWHPEKPIYEWDRKRNQGTPHTYEAIRVNQYFGNFFVNEARKNSNNFSSTWEEDRDLFYRIQPVYSQNETVFEQIYLFE